MQCYSQSKVQKGRFMQPRRAVFICLCPLHRLWSFHRETFEHGDCFKMFRFQLLSLHRLWSFHGAAKHLLPQIGEIQMFNTFELGSVLSVYILHCLWSFNGEHHHTFEHWVCFKMFRFPFLFLHRLWSFHREQLSICLLRMFNTFEHRNLDLF